MACQVEELSGQLATVVTTVAQQVKSESEETNFEFIQQRTRDGAKVEELLKELVMSNLGCCAVRC